MKQKYTFSRRGSTKEKSLRSAHLTIIILLENITIQQQQHTTRRHLRVAFLYRAILVKIITSSRALSCPTSRAPHHGQCLLAGPVDAEEVAGVEIVLDWAVPNVRAGVGPSVRGNRLVELRQEAAGGGRQWLGGGGGGGWLGGGGAGFCDPSATSSAVLLRSWVVLRFSSSTEWTVHEMACFPLL